jgi:LPXTG-site transpeptidase (sortase) family protein
MKISGIFTAAFFFLGTLAVRAESPPTISFDRNLALGSTGGDVAQLQQILIDRGFLRIPSPTGRFGPLTKAALAAWQSSAKVSPAAGLFGPISRGKINKTFVAVLPPMAAAGKGSPVSLSIPKIGVEAGFEYNGLGSDGALEVPKNIFDAGWFTGSVRPGERGVAVVTGHVARIQGGVATKPGVFARLDELKTGDTFAVRNDAGETITFTVRSVRTYDRRADATEVFTSTDGGIHLNLITCDGTWNASETSYSDRLVVFADAV